MSAPRLVLERMMHRQSIAVPGESMASYALLKVVPAGEGAAGLPITLALCIDISGSMYWADGTGKSRLDRVREAATAAIAKLKPTDRIALIAFGNGADVVLAPTSASEADKIKDTLARIDTYSVDPSGTTMDEGISEALRTLTSADQAGRLLQVIVLTDGETSGEANCRELARQAWEKQVRFTIMGVGTEWNSGLIKDLAKASDGQWYYIDAEQTDEAMRVFLAEFERLIGLCFVNVKLEVRPVKDVKVKRVRQVAPQIREVALTQVDDRLANAALGTLERTHPTKFILDLSLPRRPDGKYVVAQVEVKYDLPDGQTASTGAVPLEMTYTAAGHGYVNAEVARHIDEVQIYELNANLQQAIASDQPEEVRRVAEQIARKGQVLGPRGAKKTMLANQVLSELQGGGRVSKKTMLAVDDAARSAEDAYAG
ncbi:MAG TPA: VWA domain-containing protein [Gemmataceae bacterium]|nr:VWA domain-containing protein [Gemmataceae bacterium]